MGRLFLMDEVSDMNFKTMTVVLVVSLMGFVACDQTGRERWAVI